MASEKVLEFTGSNFDKEVIASDKPVLVDFWAAWCGPCRAIAPTIEELASEYDGKVVVGKVNVDNESEISAKFRIMTIPTIILFKNGEAVERIVGVRSTQDFKTVIDKYI